MLAANSSGSQNCWNFIHLQSGHLGFYSTYRRVASSFFGFGVKKHVQQFVQACDICQRQKYMAAAHGGLFATTSSSVSNGLCQWIS